MDGREPPSPPSIPPKLRLHRNEMIGVPLLFALPVLAVLGIFGPTTERAQAESGAVALSAEYPSRIRYENKARLVVRVENRSDRPLSEVTLKLDPDYIHAFADVAIDPAPGTPYTVPVSNLGPRESRLVSVQLTADDYGPHQGWVALSAGGDEATIPLSTFVFP